jgi:DNA-directed RNA polymerase omega subunit
MKEVVLIEKMISVIPNKYEAVRVVAKEARRINSLLIRSDQGEIEEKPTMMALRRLFEAKIKYEFVEPDELPDLEADENN